MLMLLALLVQGPSGPPPARPWALTSETVRAITVPPSARDIVLAELEYDATDSVQGTVVDLNRDGSTDYIVRSAGSLCGTGGCVYLVVDGARGQVIGQLFGEPLYVQAEESHGYPLITSYAHMNAASGNYTTWTFDGREFKRAGSRAVAGASLDSLFAILALIPAWKPPQ